MAILVSVSFAFLRLTLRPLTTCAMSFGPSVSRERSCSDSDVLACGAPYLQAVAFGADDVQRLDACDAIHLRACAQKLRDVPILLSDLRFRRLTQ
eukprot:6406870-Prymnesium_polylepis.3